MYHYVSEPKLKFNIEDCYNKIAGAAFRFLSGGHLHIWIYLKDCELAFHYVELKPMSKYLVAHYSTQKITRGFSASDWKRLGSLLAAVYLAHHI